MLKIYDDIEQGTSEWIDARCGVLTASVIGKLLTPTGKLAKNATTRGLMLDLLSQRSNKITNPEFSTRTLERGHDDEVYAKIAYSTKYATVSDCGFMTEDKWGFTLGYSPDGLVGDDGLIECKSRLQSIQIAVILDGEVPAEHMAQIQTGLLVSGRKWLDYISYPAMGGGKAMVIRVFPDVEFQENIINAAREFENEMLSRQLEYEEALKAPHARFFETERRQEEEVFV